MTRGVSSTAQFNFDRRLWRRFIKIAQPYFYPQEHRLNFWGFAALILVLLIAVVCIAFFVAVGGTLLGESLAPVFVNKYAGGLVKQVKGLVASPAIFWAGGGLIFSALAFGLMRRAVLPRWKQWSLLGLLLFLSFAVNGANVSLSYIFRFIDTALGEKNQSTFWLNLTLYGGLIITAIPILVGYRFTRLKLGLYWREWLTQSFLSDYFNDRSYYELDSNSSHTEIDNPDQRIAEDIRSFTSVTLSFLLDVLDTVLTLISFTAILYTISKPLTYGLLLYATVGTLIAVLAGRRLIKINYDQLRLEADFRYGMVHVRDNAESIAFYRGETQELRQVSRRFGLVIGNFNLLIIWQALIDLFQYGYNYFTRVVPYVIVAPLYFSGQTDLGTITQAYIAFSQVLGALSLVTNQIQQISSFAAGVNRLGAFEEVLSRPDGLEPPVDSHIQTQTAQQLSIQRMTLLTPNSEQELVRDLTVNLAPDERLLIVGASGAGKSSILRAVAGLWTNGSGIVVRPEISEMLFLPQRPYMLLGTLREQLLYPRNEETITNEQLQQVLQRVNLPYLMDRFNWDEILDWSTVLSLGEQQRLAFARVFLYQPHYAILDEATSALDVTNERHLYHQLQSTAVVYLSVGHRPTLVDYHQKVLELTGGGAWQVLTIEEYRLKLAQMVG
ncbi:peroxisomal fatty acyl CoA ABC transporter transmembrane ATP-binding protein [Gloeomargarita lithophora Alchichica-D10]|uniref:Peroxisomal fatty acyl CoA ABC transporter transmembrane ATP-binding protein n=1 Tax=Gloeomargarita lithophora Alchichica-D10 TaxID=1188229 RepID=A0A1J0ACC3_9CYAN|nr:ABC transporter ATP-binding protein/permease [Gloeomargarita lithophora]APB33561.1 peroxisomal fatty acyl CoA ABC transporter transmembrane ATP-binding protein [Gloeomargarita lithophora Alchichica-D10]